MTSHRPAHPSASSQLDALCGPIELLVLDVDGVLTDGVIAVDDNGVETKHFHVRDGQAISLWRQAGKAAAILSGRKAQAVDRRAAELGIAPVIQGAGRKDLAFATLIEGLGLSPFQVCFMGDDLPDLPVLRSVGLAACPSDAIPEVRASVHYVAETPGGRGAVREVVERILKAQGLWPGLVEPYGVPVPGEVP